MNDDNPLGKATEYPDGYDPDLLHAVKRASPGKGIDSWRCYEVSWIDSERNTTRTAKLLVTVPANSKQMVESKSLKLYLFSLNRERFESLFSLIEVVTEDLREALSCPALTVESYSPQWSRSVNRPVHTIGSATSALPDDVRKGGVDPGLLTAFPHDDASSWSSCEFREFRSLCPITKQPDWARVQVYYWFAKINRVGLLAYLTSYHDHPAYHEETCARIFRDLNEVWSPENLIVRMIYARRGGIDICPLRYSTKRVADMLPSLDV